MLYKKPTSLMNKLDFEVYLEDKLVSLDKEVKKAEEEYKYFLDIDQGKVISKKNHNDIYFSNVKLDIASRKLDHLTEMIEEIEEILNQLRRGLN